MTTLGALASGFAGSQTGSAMGGSTSRVTRLVVSNLSLAVGFVIFVFATMIELPAVGILFTGAGLGLTLSMYRSIITGLTPPNCGWFRQYGRCIRPVRRYDDAVADGRN